MSSQIMRSFCTFPWEDVACGLAELELPLMKFLNLDSSTAEECIEEVLDKVKLDLACRPLFGQVLPGQRQPGILGR